MLLVIALALAGCVNVFVFKEPVDATVMGNGAWRSNTGIGTNISNRVEAGADFDVKAH